MTADLSKLADKVRRAVEEPVPPITPASKAPPQPKQETCGCGHPVAQCAPENCSHPFAAAALWGD